MRNKKPPFEITNRMIDYIAEIAELLGKLNATDALSSSPNFAPQQPNPYDPRIVGDRAEYPFLGAGDRCFERQACSSFPQRYCRSQKCL